MKFNKYSAQPGLVSLVLINFYFHKTLDLWFNRRLAIVYLV